MAKKKAPCRSGSRSGSSAKNTSQPAGRILGSVDSGETVRQELGRLASELQTRSRQILQERHTRVGEKRVRKVAIVYDGPFIPVPDVPISEQLADHWADVRDPLVFRDPRADAPTFWCRYVRPAAELRPWEILEVGKAVFVQEARVAATPMSADGVARLAAALLTDAWILRALLARKNYVTDGIETHVRRMRAALEELVREDRRARQNPRTKAHEARRMKAAQQRETQMEQMILLARGAHAKWLKNKDVNPTGRLPKLLQIQTAIREAHVDQSGKPRLSLWRIQKRLTRDILEKAGLAFI